MKSKNIIGMIGICFLLVLLLNGIAFAESTSEENNPYGSSIRITMRSSDGGMGFCSGTIIKIDKERAIATILTAGHCLQSPKHGGGMPPGGPQGGPQGQMPFDPYSPYQNPMPQPYQQPYQQPYNQPYMQPYQQPYQQPGGGGCPGGVCPINPYSSSASIVAYGGPMGTEFLIDWGPGTRQVRGEYLAHEFNDDMGTRDIGLLTVAVDTNDLPAFTRIADESSFVSVGDKVYDIGYPGGNDISVVGCKMTALSDPLKGAGFSVVNFPPKGGRSGGGIFTSTDGSGAVYTRGKLIGIMTNVDLQAGTGLFTNTKQIYNFLKRVAPQLAIGY